MEKVARREIGTLATVHRLPPGQKVIAPDSLPHLAPYYRRPLNFGCLDDIGHGIKVERGPLLFPRTPLSSFMSPFSPGPQFAATPVFSSQSPGPFFPSLSDAIALNGALPSKPPPSSRPLPPWLAFTLSSDDLLRMASGHPLPWGLAGCEGEEGEGRWSGCA